MVICVWMETQHLFVFHRYKLLVNLHSPGVSNREQTVVLLDMIGAKEDQYQLGLNKVLSWSFM